MGRILLGVRRKPSEGHTPRRYAVPFACYAEEAFYEQGVN
jgi:hypothetical protein